MKNKVKLFLACVSLLSTSCFSAVSSTATIDPIVVGQINENTRIVSGHQYYIYNDSSSDQIVSVCYSTIACIEYPQWTKQVSKCDQVSVPKGLLKSGNESQLLMVNYPFVGWCDTQTYTAIYGFETGVTGGQGKLQITNGRK